MASWYLVKLRYQKEDSAGQLKAVNEVHLVDSVSFTDAESAAYSKIITGSSDFTVTSITKMPLADLFITGDGSGWFKTKVVYESVDEKSGRAKRILNNILVDADSLDQALERIHHNMKDWLIPYVVEAIALTPILDVFPYVSSEDEGEVGK